MIIPGTSNQVQALQNGTNALPFYSWASDPNVGMWRPTTDQLAFSAGGVEFIRLKETTVNELVFNEGAAVINTRVESQNDQNMLFVDAATDRVGIKTNTPQATLHIAGNNNSIRVDELNAANNTHNLGTEPAPVYVDSNGELSLQPTLVQSYLAINNTSFISGYGVTISSSSGAAQTTNLGTATINLTQESLVYFSYHFSVELFRQGTTWGGGSIAITDGAPRMFRAWVEVNSSTEIAYSTGTYTNSNTSGSTLANGYYYLAGNGYVQLPAGNHVISLRALGYGGGHDFRMIFGGAGQNLFQAVVHK